MDQTKTPLSDALDAVRTERIVPFDVPGHKRGRGNRLLTDFLGERCLSVDVNSMKSLDNLSHPVSVIRKAEDARSGGLRCGARVFHGRRHYLRCTGDDPVPHWKSGDKIILPRNVHQSVINAMVLCGAVPVYVNPRNRRAAWHRALGMTYASVERAVLTTPDAKAVLINNPTLLRHLLGYSANHRTGTRPRYADARR